MSELTERELVELITPDQISPVLRAIGEHVVGLAQTIAIETGFRGLVRVDLAPELGPLIGVAPGSSVGIMTPAGPVEVHVERVAGG